MNESVATHMHNINKMVENIYIFHHFCLTNVFVAFASRIMADSPVMPIRWPPPTPYTTAMKHEIDTISLNLFILAFFLHSILFLRFIYIFFFLFLFATFRCGVHITRKPGFIGDIVHPLAWLRLRATSMDIQVV